MPGVVPDRGDTQSQPVFETRFCWQWGVTHRFFSWGMASSKWYFGKINWVAGSRAGWLRVWCRSRENNYTGLHPVGKDLAQASLPLRCHPWFGQIGLGVPLRCPCNNLSSMTALTASIANACLLVLVFSAHQDGWDWASLSLYSWCLDKWLSCSRKCLWHGWISKSHRLSRISPKFVWVLTPSA